MAKLNQTEIEDLNDIIDERSKEGVGYYNLNEEQVKDVLCDILMYDVLPYILFHPNFKQRAMPKLEKEKLYKNQLK